MRLRCTKIQLLLECKPICCRMRGDFPTRLNHNSSTVLVLFCLGDGHMLLLSSLVHLVQFEQSIIVQLADILLECFYFAIVYLAYLKILLKAPKADHLLSINIINNH